MRKCLNHTVPVILGRSHYSLVSDLDHGRRTVLAFGRGLRHFHDEVEEDDEVDEAQDGCGGVVWQS